MSELLRFFRETVRADRGMTFRSNGKTVNASYADLFASAERMALQLRRLRMPDRFMAALWTDADASFVAMMAVLIAGGIPIPLHPHGDPSEATAVCSRFVPDALIASSAKWRTLPEAWAPAATTRIIDAGTGQRVNGGVARREIGGSAFRPPAEAAVVFLTSGSGGTPKGVMLSETNLLTNVDGIQRYVGLNESDRVLVAKSPGYCSTITGEWLLALLAGANIDLYAGLRHPLEWAGAVKADGTTFLCTVPSVAASLAKSQAWKDEELRTLRSLLIVGGGMSGPLLSSLLDRLPQTKVMPSYGLTEASPRVSYLPAEQARRRPDSVGIPIVRTEISIVREGEIVTSGEEGEIVVRGPGVMLGYFDDPERSARTLGPFGLRTSDRGYLDGDGYLYVTGRTDQAINVGGHTLYPEPVERTLLRYRGIAEAAVTGVPDEIWGQRLVACVVPSAAGFAERELAAFIQRHLHGAERPREVYTLDRLPYTASGKLDRPALKRLARERSG